jgi:hypothetical protein
MWCFRNVTPLGFSRETKRENDLDLKQLHQVLNIKLLHKAVEI